MAVTNLTKGVFTVLGVGPVLGLGYAGKSWIIGDRIIDLLKENHPNKRLLTRNSPTYSKRWKEAWLKYRQKNTNTNIWNLGDWKAENQGATLKADKPAPTSFIDACQTNSEVRVSSTSNELYQQVLEWCTGDTSVSIKELIRESGRRTLDKTNDFKKSKDSGWTPLLKKYLTAHKTNPLKVADWKEDLNVDGDFSTYENVINDFIKKCTELSDKQVDNTEDPNYKNAVTYCSDDIKAEDLIKESGKKIIDTSKLGSTEGGKVFAKEVWQKYTKKNQNKAKGEDEWKIKDWEPNKQDWNEVPASFWENCKSRRKTKAETIDETVQKVIDYCSLPKGSSKEYAETEK